MRTWEEFVDKTKTLLSSGNFEEAKEDVEAGLNMFPKQFHLLIVAMIYTLLQMIEKNPFSLRNY